MTFNELPDLLTVNEVADYLRLTNIQVYNLIYDKKLPAFKVGGSWRIKKETIQELMRGEE